VFVFLAGIRFGRLTSQQSRLTLIHHLEGFIMKSLFFASIALVAMCGVASAQLAVQLPLRAAIPVSPLLGTPLQPRLQLPIRTTPVQTPIQNPLLPGNPRAGFGGGCGADICPSPVEKPQGAPIDFGSP
jgi:hypothetical protein